MVCFQKTAARCRRPSDARTLICFTTSVRGMASGVQCTARAPFRTTAMCLLLCVVASSTSPFSSASGGTGVASGRGCFSLLSFADAAPGKSEPVSTVGSKETFTRQRLNPAGSDFASHTENRGHAEREKRSSAATQDTPRKPFRAKQRGMATLNSSTSYAGHSSTGPEESRKVKRPLSCPITPLTTPVPPSFVFFIMAVYGLVVASTFLWWLLRAARWKRAARRQALLAEELIAGQEEKNAQRPHHVLGLDTGTNGSDAAEEEAQDVDAAVNTVKKERRLRYERNLYKSPLIFVRGMLLHQEGCDRSLLGSVVKNVLIISIAVAAVLPFVGTTAAVVRGSRVGLTALFIPNVFFEAELPGPPPTDLEVASARRSRSGSLERAEARLKGTPQHEARKSFFPNHAAYWAANTECMQIRERVCITLILFCFGYLALAQGLWKHVLRDICLVPAPLSSCSFLRVRYAYLPHHLIEKLARQWTLAQLRSGEQQGARGSSAQTSASELRRARFTALASATADAMAGGRFPEKYADLVRKPGAPASPGATQKGCLRPPSEELSGMFLTEQEASQWGVGHYVLTRAVVEVRHSIGIQTHRFVDVESMRLRYSASDAVFILMAAVQEEEAITNARRLVKAILEASGETATDRVLRVFHRVLLRPADVADRLSVEQNRLRLPSTPFWDFVISSLLRNSVYLAFLGACWYHCFTHNFLLLAVLLAFATFELFTRARLMAAQQSSLLGFAAEREKAIVDQPATLLRILDQRDPDRPGGSRLVSAWVKAPATSIVPGDIVRLTRGGTVPCDVLLVNGTVAVDESSLRGDVAPSRKRPLRASMAAELSGSYDGQASCRVWTSGHVADSLAYAGTRVISCTEARGRSRTLDAEGLSTAVEAEEARTKACKTGKLDACTNFDLELDAAAGVQSQVVTALMDAGASNEGGICWGVAVRTGMQTASGQQLRRLQFPEPEMFRFDRQLPWVCLIMLVVWIILLSIHASHTRSLLLSFRYAVESLLSLLPLWLPGLCGLFAALAARRLRMCSGAEIDRFVAATLERQAYEEGIVAALPAQTGQSGRHSGTLAAGPSKMHKDEFHTWVEGQTSGVETRGPISVVRPFLVACATPGKLPLAAKVRVVCFDKTGTLTREDFSFIGCQPVEGEELKAFVPYDPAGPSPAFSAERQRQAEQARGAVHRMRDRVRGTCTLQGLLPTRLLECLACCHGLWVVGERVTGTPLEQQMLQASGWRIELTSEGGSEAEALGSMGRLTFLPPGPTRHANQEGGAEDLGGGFLLLQRFLFDPVRQLMSVVVARTSDAAADTAEVLVFCKGSYEAVAALCRPETVPPSFLECAGTYAREGVYVLAAACKSLGVRGELNAWRNLDRATIECELDLQGLLLFRNELRADAPEAIQQLRAARIRSVIVTGDSPLTAISVARRTGMVGSSSEDAVLSGGRRLQKLGSDDSVDGRHPVILGDVVDHDSASPAGISEVPRDSGTAKQGNASPFWDRVKWVDVDAGEEVEGWRILFTEEYRELALTASAVEILAEVPDTTLAHHVLPQDDSEDLEDGGLREGWSTRSRSRSGSQASRGTNETPLLPNDALCLQGDPEGRTGRRPSSIVSSVKGKPPSLMDRILLRVRIFARMSPHTKALVVELFQRRDLVVAMVGDGTNDCFAIKQAHVGVAFGRGGLCHSVAPFAVVTDQRRALPAGAARTRSNAAADPSTDASKEQALSQFDSCGVLGILTLVREGRATLVTSFAVYKLQILYGILSSIAYLMLAVGAYGTPNPFASFFSSVAMLLGLSLAMLWSVPSLAPLTRRSPSSNPLGSRAIVGVATVVLVDVLALLLLFVLLYGPARRPLPCAWLRKEVRDELLQRQHVEQLLKLHDVPPDTVDRWPELTQAPREHDDEGDKKQGALQHQVPHQKARRSGTEQGRPPARNRSTKPAVSKSSSSTTGAATASRGSRQRKLEKSLSRHSFVEAGTRGATQVSLHARKKVVRRVWVSEQQQSHSGERVVARGGEGERSIPNLERYLKDSSGIALPQKWIAQSWAESGSSGRAGTASGDSSCGQGPQPSVGRRAETCSRDGRTEASIIFVWLGACLLNAALIFSRGGAFRKSLWANPLLLPLSFLFGAFLIILVAVPESELSCVFMVNCPAKEVRKQQEARNVIGIVKRIVSDAEEKDMYSRLAREAEHEVLEARELLGLSPDVENREPLEPQKGVRLSSERITNDRTATPLPTVSDEHMWEQVGLPSKRVPKEQHLAETKELLTMDLEWQRKKDNQSTQDGGSVISTWFGQMLLYVLCLMSILNGVIHVYVIGERNGSLSLLDRCRRGLPLQWKSETVPI